MRYHLIRRRLERAEQLMRDLIAAEDESDMEFRQETLAAIREFLAEI